MTTSTATLQGILSWLQATGEVRAIDRLRVVVLPALLDEGIFALDANTDVACSPECLAIVKKAAEDIAGSPCPA